MTTSEITIANGAEPRVQFRLESRSIKLDRRTHAVRGDLADVSLAGVLFAPHYAKAMPMHCIKPSAFVREKNAASAPAVSQLLYGEEFHVLDVTGDWAWGFCGHDGYVGYVLRDALDPVSEAPAFRVTSISAPVFASADIKSPVVANLPMGAIISGTLEGDLIATAHGYVHSRHVTQGTQSAEDYVAVAQRFLGQPYVWGARGGGGLDCSGLVQMALGMCGHKVPRDTDMQREGIGSDIAEGAALQRGDLVFFPGHVGIMTDGEHILHANAYWMAVVIEPLADVLARLQAEHEQPIIARRRIAA